MTSRAPVRPRFVSPSTGEALTLEESVVEAVRHFHRGVIEIAGPPGSGKTCAVSHLHAVMPDDLAVEFLTDIDAIRRADKICSVVEVHTDDVQHDHQILRFDLAPWGLDEVIEYCLSRFGENGARLTQRVIGARDLDLLDGNAELFAFVIDSFAADENLQSVLAAFQSVIASETDGNRDRLPEVSRLLDDDCGLVRDSRSRRVTARLQPLLRHRSFRSTVMAMILADDIDRGNLDGLDQYSAWLLNQRSDVRELMPRLLSRKAQAVMRAALDRRNCLTLHPLLASVLYQCDRTWRPRVRCRPNLQGAVLRMANWPSIDLRRYELRAADLTGANLDGSLLIGARTNGACFSAASLKKAVLKKICGIRTSFKCCDLSGVKAARSQLRNADFSYSNAEGADFDSADLSGADLTEACFRGVSFRKAWIDRAVLDQVDLTGADLSRALLCHVDLRTTVLDATVLEHAKLAESNLEGVVIEDARFRSAMLWRADLTSSVMPNADFRGARFRGAYLADIRWPGADLRHANLAGVTFHMGSSRSGLVGSDLASEGTRTGFYTDDYDDHTFRSPEEIRVADLTGCDLRDAVIDGVDFWRVDLRGARILSSQWQQLIATGAILD